MSIPSINGSRLLLWVAKTVPTSCPASATHGGVSHQDPLCTIPLSNKSRVPNFQAADWYLLVRSAAAFRLEIKCRIIVMCLNHPKPSSPTLSPWKNCLPGNWSVMPKRLGTASANHWCLCHHWCLQALQCRGWTTLRLAGCNATRYLFKLVFPYFDLYGKVD